jgi:hypothetical protein
VGINEDILPGGVHEAPQRNKPQPHGGAAGVYIRNQYKIMANTIGDDNSTNSDGTHNTIAAATVNLPDSTLGGTTVCPVLSGAMAQLASNQAAMMTQMAALHIAPAQPPMQQIMIPKQQYTGGGRGGRGGYRGNEVMDTGATQQWIGYAPPPTGGFTAGTNQSGGRGRGRRPRRNYGTVAAANQQQLGMPPPLFGGANQIVPYGGFNQAQRTTVPNPVKQFANWNYCFSCGFDVAQDRRRHAQQHGVRLDIRKGVHPTMCNSTWPLAMLPVWSGSIRLRSLRRTCDGVGRRV